MTMYLPAEQAARLREKLQKSRSRAVRPENARSASVRPSGRRRIFSLGDEAERAPRGRLDAFRIEEDEPPARTPLSPFGRTRQAEALLVRPDTGTASPFRLSEFERSREQASINRRAPQQGAAFPAIAASGISRNVQRPIGAIYEGGEFLRRDSAITNPGGYLQSLRRGFQDPRTGQQAAVRAGISDRDVIGPLSPADIIGGVTDIALDPIDLATGGTLVGTDALRAGGRVAARAGRAADATGARALGLPNAALRRADPTRTAPERSAPGLGQQARAGVAGELPQFRPRTAGGAIATGPDAASAPPASTEIMPFAAPESGRALFGLEDITPGLSRGRRAQARVDDALGRAADNEIATPAMQVRARVQPRIKAQAARFSAQMDELVQRTFEPGKSGRIQSLPGAPTIQDVAARRPEFADALSTDQFRALERLEGEAARYRQFLDETGIGESIGSRPDVMDGGFYLPRGNAALEDADAPLKVRAGRGGGKAGFQRQAQFESMSEGIEAGFEYSSLRDALRSYAEDAGKRGVDQHVANYFKATGLGETAADRIDPALRARVQSLRGKISGRRQTFRNRVTRQQAQERASGEAERTADFAERVRTGREDAFDLRTGLDTEAAIKAAQRELRTLQRIANRTEAAGQTARGRSERTAIGAAQTRDELIALQDELDGIREDWMRAQIKAAQTPRDQGTIGGPLPLQGTSFPDEIANAVNKVLKDEGELTGPGADVQRSIIALNNLIRGVNATGEMSYAGIQGAIGLGSDQTGYARALKAATRAWGNNGDRVLGAFIEEFDAKATQKGAPNSSQWAARGLQIGGAETEYQIGRGAGKVAEALKNAPLARQANRAFGYFGDALRLEMADTLFDDALRRGENVLDPKVLDDIATTANRVTGWSPNRFAGSWGEMLQFAPRYFASRLQTLGQMAFASPRKRRLARRTFGRFVGTMTLLTVAANEALGNDTDFNPVKQINGQWVKNSEFMRIRLGGRDWTLFGQWDSMLGMLINLSTGHPEDSARVLLNSPAVSAAWDLLSGEGFMGEATRGEGPLGGVISPETGKFLLKRPLPFAAEEIGEGAQQLVTGDDPVQGAAKIGAAFVGARGSDLSPTDRLNELTESGEFYNAPPEEQERIRQENPELWREAVERGSEPRQQAEAQRTALQQQQAADDVRLESGAMSVAEWKDERRRRQIELSAAQAQIYRDFPERQPDPDKPWEQYWAKIAETEAKFGGRLTDDAWGEIDAWRATLTPEQNQQIDDNTGVRATPAEKQYRTTARELEGTRFFDLRNDAWAAFKRQHPQQLAALPGDYHEWRETEIADLTQQKVAAGTDPRTAYIDSAREVAGYKTVNLFNEYFRTQHRHQWVVDNPDLAKQAELWGYFTPDKAEREFLRGERQLGGSPQQPPAGQGVLR